jgi:hypothetical protein
MERNPQRRLNSSIDKPNIAPRDGAPKNIAEPAITPDMKRQTSGELHPYLHGQTLDDSAPDKRTAPVTPHSATPSRADRGKHIDGQAAAVLESAARLGRPITSGGSAPGANGPATTKA